MGSLRRFNLRAIRELADIDLLVETGTGAGISLSWALKCGFREAHSIEIEERLYHHNVNQFANNASVKLHFGESATLLKSVASGVQGNKLVYLDAHFVGGADFGMTPYGQATEAPESFPLLDELGALQDHFGKGDILIVDDARMYLEGGFQLGECPEFARQWDRREELEALFER